MNIPEQFCAKNAFIITGGPGSGKTTLLEALQSKGIAVKPEVGREVIVEQLEQQTDALPWMNPGKFAEVMFHKEMQWYEKLRHAEEGLVLCDRGLPDIVGYLLLNRLPVPDYINESVIRLRYNQTVFIAPFWPEIYRQDAERKQSLEEAEQTFVSMMATYRHYGYNPLLLPLTTVAARVDLMIKHLSAYRQTGR